MVILTPNDKKTVLALTAKDNTAATEHTMRSDLRVSLCEYNF